MNIGISKGHSPLQGAVGIRNETKDNVEVGDLLISKLRKLGHTAIDVTPSSVTSVSQNLIERVNAANSYNLDLFVELHENSFYDASANGCECLYYSEAGKAYAVKVAAELAKLGYSNRGAKLRTDLYVLRNTKAVAILVESFFVSNQSDCYKYNASNIANAICMAVVGEIPVDVIVPTIVERIVEVQIPLNKASVMKYLEENLR